MSVKQSKAREEDVSTYRSSNQDGFSSDNADYDSLSGSKLEDDDKDLQKLQMKKVAGIMNKLLSSQESEGGSILSKIKKKEKDSDYDENEQKERKPNKVELKRKWNEKSRSKPDLNKDYEKERKLKIIATQGVIQLFNTIEKHKSGLREQLKRAKSTSEREKIVDKNGLDSFMNLLKREGNKPISHMKSEETKKAKHDALKEVDHKSSSSWNVFAHNYYKEPSLKGWDQSDSDDS